MSRRVELNQQDGTMIRVWGRSNSNNVKKVLWCLEEAGLSYERIDAGGSFGKLDTPEFFRLNPNRKIPVLEDGETVLWESNSIVRYLAAQYAPDTLHIQEPAKRALADQWMDWASLNFVPPFTTIFWTLVRTAPEQRDMARVEAAVRTASELLTVADEVLGSKLFLSGQALGIGDIPLGTLIHAWFNLPIDRPNHANLRAWYDRLLARPGYSKVVAVPLS